MPLLDPLVTEVEQTKNVIDSAIVLIQGLAAQVAATKGDPAAVDALVADLTAKTDALSAAVAANTAAAPPPQG